MQNLSIGIQTLTQIRAKNAIYVDKTRLIHQLVNEYKYIFLSRPRRFGKSLLVATLKQLYLGNKPIFEGLWILDEWDWEKKNPVIHLSFDAAEYRVLGLYDAILKLLDACAAEYNIKLEEKSMKLKFQELLLTLRTQHHAKVVLLIDEYDKPIIDFLGDATLDIARKNRLIMRDFYGILKNADDLIEFVFITGISKFAQVSIFSHLNNLKDITLSRQYATLTGYTQEEIEHYFKDYLDRLQVTLDMPYDILLKHIATWYNGFSWDGVHKVYNPFGVLNLLADQQFLNYWFATGTPDFLIEQMKKNHQFNIENTIVNAAILNKFDIENMELIPLLFQTGYLTVKSMNVMNGDMVLDYPNQEVRESMYMFLMDDLAKNPQRLHSGRTISDLHQAFIAKNLTKVRAILHAILADLPSQVYQKQTEGLFHGLVHVIFNYLGILVQSEVHSAQGRADAVVETLTDIFIFEFKFNKNAQLAIQQIHAQQYADKYLASGKKITGIGVNFNGRKKKIDDWVEVDLGV